MNWTELKKEIYFCDGSLRDICILRTNIEDNKKWTDYVNENFIVKWFNGLTQTEEIKINFDVVQGYLNGDHDLSSSASLSIDKIQINNHFFSYSEIENDISPNEINTILDHEKLIKYMSDLSMILDKPVLLTPENEHKTILLRVTNKKVEYLPRN